MTRHRLARLCSASCALVLGGAILTSATMRPVDGAPSVPAAPLSSPVTTPAGSALLLLQKKGEAAIDRRLDSLSQLHGSLSSATSISDGDRALLLGDIDRATSGLADVRSTIVLGASFRAVSDAVGTIIGSYRVYSVLVPRCHLVMGVALAQEAADTLERVNKTLAPQAADAPTRALATWSEATIAIARTGLAPVIASVLSLDAAGWPGNKTALDSAKAALIDARRSLGTALDATTRLASGVPANP